MFHKRTIILKLICCVLLTCAAAHGAEGQTWKRSLAVGKFPQKMSERYDGKDLLPGDNVRSIVVCGGRVYFGTEKGIGYFEGGNWGALTGLNGRVASGVSRLQCADHKGGIRFGTSAGMYSFINEKLEAVPGLDRPVTSFTDFDGGILIGTTSGLYLFAGGSIKKIDEFGKLYVTDIVVDADGIAWIGTENGLAKYDGSKTVFYRGGDGSSAPLHDNIRSLYLDPTGTLWIGTPVGISKFDRISKWDYLTGKHGGLPYEDVLVITGQNGTLWVGTTVGAARYDGSDWQYFQGTEYLPDDRVEAIGAAPDGSVWLGTPAGVSKVWYKMMTLEEKAKFFEDINRKNHNRYGLFSDSHLKIPGDYSSNVMDANDNDGLWTAMYIAAECFRYGATGDPEARKFARESLNSLERLESVTGIPGFMARSFAKPDDRHDGGEWEHISKDGKWRWKGDTSSDEVVGHFYAYSVYYDICADDNEKEEISKVVERIASYIVDNGLRLLDTDGKPTTFGHWNPKHFSAEGRFQRGLNSLEILSHLLTAYHITGNEKFFETYRDLIQNNHYAKYTVDQKLNQPYIINHSDDELAFLSYYPLMKYETHPFVLQYLQKSLVRSWKIERQERNPLWNFIYASEMPGDFDVDSAVWTLKKIPLTVLRWGHRNSQRADVTIDLSAGRFAEIQSEVPVPPDERTLTLWNENPYALDSSGNGSHEQPGTFFLLPYWMGRYYGFIVEQQQE